MDRALYSNNVSIASEWIAALRDLEDANDGDDDRLGAELYFEALTFLSQEEVRDAMKEACS